MNRENPGKNTQNQNIDISGYSLYKNIYYEHYLKMFTLRQTLFKQDNSDEKI